MQATPQVNASADVLHVTAQEWAGESATGGVQEGDFWKLHVRVSRLAACDLAAEAIAASNHNASLAPVHLDLALSQQSRYMYFVIAPAGAPPGWHQSASPHNTTH